MPKPYWKKSHKCWYVNLNEKQVRLDTDEEKAWTVFYRLMAGRSESDTGDQLVSSTTTVRQLLAAYLQWSENHNEKPTHDYYVKYLTGRRGFGAAVEPMLRVADLKNFHVTRFLDKHYLKVNDTTRGNAIAAVKRPFNWAVEQQYLKTNPIGSYKKPPQIGRAGVDEVIVSEQQYKDLLAAINSREFNDYVEFLWETGCRPEEINKLQTAWFKRNESRCVFPLEETKGNKRRRVKKPRIILLNARALEIATRNALKNQEGHLFRNCEGRAWTAYSVSCTFGRLKKTVGRKYVATWFRHTFITRCAEKGIPIMHVAKLVGHDDLQMITRVYEHVGYDSGELCHSLERTNRRPA